MALHANTQEINQDVKIPTPRNSDDGDSFSSQGSYEDMQMKTMDKNDKNYFTKVGNVTFID